MDRDIQNNQNLITNTLRGGIICSLGLLSLVGVEIIFRLIKGPLPLPSVIMVTIIIYGVLGLGLGFFFGLFTPLERRFRQLWCDDKGNKFGQDLKSHINFLTGFTSLLFRMGGKGGEYLGVDSFLMAACIATIILLDGILLINKHILRSSSPLMGFLGNAGFILFCLFIFVALYLFFRRVVHTSHLVSSFLALSLSINTFMIGGLYINQSLLPGRFFTFNLINIGANCGIIIGCMALYFLLFLSFKFLSSRMMGFFHFKTVVIILAAVLIGGAITWYIYHDSIPKVPPSQTTSQLIGNPNIILITLDTTRADHLSCYGYHRKTTPNLNKLAEESLLFKNAYSTSNWTLPAHASILTGLYPSKHGAHSTPKAGPYTVTLNESNLTLAEILSAKGYRTAAVVGAPYCRSLFGLNQSFDYYNDHIYTINTDFNNFMVYKMIGKFFPLKDLSHRYGYVAGRNAGQINDIVFPWLEKNYDSPFFLFINFFDSHAPYMPPRPFDNLFDGKNETLIKNYKKGRNKINYCDKERQIIIDVLSRKHDLTPAEKKHFLSQYDGEIAYLDFQMGRLFKKLKDLIVYDNTMVVIVGDHGENFGEHHLMSHLGVFNEVLRVPLIIKYPYAQKLGIISHLVSITGIVPTILSTLNFSLPEDIQGKRLTQPEQDVIAEHFDRKQLKYDSRDFCAIYRDEFKYVWSASGNDKLFDMVKDPRELNNLVNKYPGKAEELREHLDNWLVSSSPEQPRRKFSRVDKTTEKSLKALGYIK